MDVVAILIASSSAIITLLSLIYAIKQRQVIKKEIEKKRYLENAQTNLTEIINHLRSIELPDLTDASCDLQESLGDEYNDASTITEQILGASFESKRTKFTLEVGYELIDFGERHKDTQAKDWKRYDDFSQLSPKLLMDLLRTNRTFMIESKTVIPDYQRRVVNEISFHTFEWGLTALKSAMDKLAKYEEVYETVCPNITETASRLLEQVCEEIFNVISESKKVEIDLTKFLKVDDIARYLYETYLNYNHISKKFSKGNSELDSKLAEARKQLFLRISP